MLRSGRYPNASDNFRTDKWILQIFDGWFDPCPYDPDVELDGLALEWPNLPVFINPPYSNPLPWVVKAIHHSNTVALLLKHDSSTRWFKLLHEAGAHFLLVNGRLSHQTGRPASFPSVLAILSRDPPEGPLFSMKTLRDFGKELGLNE